MVKTTELDPMGNKLDVYTFDTFEEQYSFFDELAKTPEVTIYSISAYKKTNTYITKVYEKKEPQNYTIVSQFLL